MPYDQTAPRDDASERREAEHEPAIDEPAEDDLAGSLGALFTLFGGQVVEPGR